ncbi:type I restriction enzyme HsdR N-terminal domain-containing protein [Natronolimnohabitans innermongolicus]|uniref:Type I restriction enzyme R protein N-terminal domain-containing protein n=1 Tax=Natronolimnohabitans innermongolicus JCM 12255 TaxID=1227499 RepID=L9XNL2_9EURY|nr:type I restriction enzyme HsdR N-terminal domain-containing protein [Natronolimnohabitans innermongolicus]ELY62233.1 hypothetical protein C493_00365 [Natronolimnohabitans innermongolicus JCM 12255]
MNVIEPTISREIVTDFVSTSESIIEQSPQMNESNTKLKLIQPFLQNVLGWEIHDMELEYSVQMGGQTYHVDYALAVNDLPKVFVEAKGCDVTLKDKHVNQLQSYLKLQDITWGVLTNGKEFRLYQLEVQDGQAEFHLIAAPSIEELNGYRRAFSAISKPAIVNGSAADVVRYIRELNKAEEALETRKPEIAEAVAETVTKNTTDVIYQEAEQEAKELVDRLVKELQTDHESVVEDSSPESTSKSDINEGGDLPVTALSDIEGDDNSHTAVYASDESGVEFLQKYKAWGFISIASEPEYFLLYITRPQQQIRYLGMVEDIVDADHFVSTKEVPKDKYQYGDGKKVVKFSELYELEDPIPLGESSHRMQGLLYTTLGEAKTAKSTDDL